MTMTQAEIIALSGALLTSVLGLRYRGFIRTREDCTLLAFWNSLAGGIFLAAVLPFPGLGSISTRDGFYLMVSGLLWTAMVYFDLRAYGTIELCLNALLNSARLALLVVVGALLFDEPAATHKFIGVALMVTALWITVRGNRLRFRYGLPRILAVGCGTAAVGIDKALSQRISIELILMNGYLLPTIFFGIYGMQQILSQGSYTKARLREIFITSLLLAATGYCLIVPIGTGELGTTMILNQMTIVFSLALGIMVLKERQNLLSKTVAAALATIGAIIAITAS